MPWQIEKSGENSTLGQFEQRGVLVTFKPTFLFSLALSLVMLAAPPGCKSKSDAPEGNGESESSTEAVDSEPAPCEFVRASQSLVSINVETENRQCTIVLPQEVAPGDLPVAVSVAGRTDVASIEIRTETGGYYYANEGTVTVLDVGANRVRGHFVATDSNPPDTGGPWRGEFDVAF